ncbi:hypothetical protein [Actinomadura rugatobispora]|uniref:HEAT repeat domain-containing protein n=1 Tax=Actinomadura rugatobispora TaxID=1994 RepID=A0ABW1A8L8_9ACTN|nr:hypothetical protein GCM10010200_003900 [Actinomadura rugatobispora]
MRETARQGDGPAFAQPVLSLLEDGDVEERRAPGNAISAQAAEIAGGGVHDADRLVAGLRARRPGVHDRAARLGVLLAAGELARGCSAAVLPETLIWLRGLRDARGGDPHVRLAAAMALAFAVETERPGAAIGALAEAPDTEVWREVPWVGVMPAELTGLLGGTGAALVRWAGDALGVAARTELCLTLAGHPDGDRRTGAVQVAAKLVTRWRSPAAPLLPALTEWTGDPVVAVREYATHVLAALRAGADALAGRLGDRAARSPDLRYQVADIAAWGLARQGDPRCVPHLVERLDTGRELGQGGDGGAAPYGYSPVPPGIAAALVPMRAHAAALLPPLRARLRDHQDGAATLLRVLARWEDDAAPALPEIMPLLETGAHDAAVSALAATGSAEAAAVLEGLLDRPPGRLPTWNPGLSRLGEARAHWRLTGDPGRFAAALDAVFRPEHVQAHWRDLAALGPDAAAFTGRLRPLLAHRDLLKRVAAAYALFKITGDAGQARDILWEAVHPIAARSHSEVAWTALRHLTETGPAQPRMRPILEEILASDRRHRAHDGFRAVDEDAALRADAAALLADD